MTQRNSLVFFLFLIFILNQSLAQNITWDKQQKSRLNKIADSLSRNLKPWIVPKRIFKVEDYGAIGDSTTINTSAIQTTINKCSVSGGGVVLFSKGNYVTGTIELKSGVMLEVTSGSRIIGSVNLADYPEKTESFKSVMSENHKYRQSLIYAEKCNQIGIRGKGEIYFRGEKVNFPGKETTGEIAGRPFGIRVIECKNIYLKDIFLHNSAAWMQSYIFCQNLIFDGIKVINQANYNNDGLDPDGCTNVIVRNCYINSEDDAMCLKGASGKPSSNILIENSEFITSCNALKIGTDTQGDFFNIIARNLKIGGIPESMFIIKSHQASTGITIATVDGGNVENILISNIEINRSRCPIFLRIGNRLRIMPGLSKPSVGYLKNIIIENITGNDNFKQGSLISGINGHTIKNIQITNYKVAFIGGGDTSLINQEVPEKENGYPDAQGFLKEGLPSYGFYIRYAENIYLNNVNAIPLKTDQRPFIKLGKEAINVVKDKQIIN